MDPQQPVPPTGRRARREDQPALPALPALASGNGGNSGEGGASGQPGPEQSQQPGGRRARRALAAAQERTAAEAGPRTAFALPPADADRAPIAPDVPGTPGDGASTHHARTAPDAGRTPPQAHPVAPAHSGPQTDGTSGQGFPVVPEAAHAPGPHDGGVPEAPGPAPDLTSWGDTGQNAHSDTGQNTHTGAGRTAHTTGVAAVADPVAHPADGDAGVPAPDARRQPLPAEEPMPDGSNPDSTQGRAFSVRTLGQGVPFAQHLAHQQNQPHQSLGGAGRRRKLAAPPEGDRAPARTAGGRQAPPEQDRPGTPAPASVPGRSRIRPTSIRRTRARTRLRSPAGRVSRHRAGPAPPTARGSCSRRPSRRGAPTP